MTDFTNELVATAHAIAVRGKGILAADESTGTIGKRFQSIGVENTEENRRNYRQLLITCPDLDKYISGIILYEETLKQSADDGRTFADILRSRNIVIGIKLDKGTVPLAGTNNETTTQGLDDLGKRCAQFYAAGARFSKWRAVLNINDNHGLTPSNLAIMDNAETLARYASICQANGLVPIVEPEILMDGEHTIEQAAVATEKVLSYIFKALHDHHVLFEGMLLKPNMVRSGESSSHAATSMEIAALTVRTMQRCVCPAVPGIMFLSGGMSEEEATNVLNLMNSLTGPGSNRPWSLSFSYGRALQQSCLAAWRGLSENVSAAQRELSNRARANSLAQLGLYVAGDGGSGVASMQSSHVANYTY